MKYFIPTYEQALKIVESNPAMTFYMTKHFIDDFEVHIFNYKLAFYKEFLNPVADKDWTAHEMRGLVFTMDKYGKVNNRFILLNKFWNINQNEETLLHNLKDKKIKYITNKLDGSIASFIRLPNGKVFGRSKASFSSDQAIAITEIYNADKNINKFVNWSLDNNIVAIFEYVSPKNKIVLDYATSKLILLKLRNNLTGEYIDIDSIDKKVLSGIEIAENEPIISLEELVESAKTMVDKEGSVVQFEDGSLVKQKTDWYFKRHRLLMDQLNRENDVIDLILNEQIDDAISQLGDSEVDKTKRKWIENIQSIINKYISTKIDAVSNKLLLYEELKKTVKIQNASDKDYRKVFVMKYGRDKDFPLVMKVVDGKDIFSVVKELTIKNTKGLMEARKFIEKNNV